MYAAAARARLYSWLIALLLPLFAVYLALAYPIEESAYDAAAIHVPRSVIFSADRSDGWLLPRWSPEMNAGLGSPVFSFYSPLPYLLMDGLNRLGVPHPIAWRLLVALGFEIASAGAFGLGLALFGEAGVALACAAAFAYAPYLLQEFFERGSPAGLAVALAPWVLWALYRLWQRPTGVRLALAAAAWAGLTLAHNLTGLLFAPAVAVFLGYLALRGRPARLLAPLAALLAGTALAAFHVLPFLAESQYVQLKYINAYDFELPAQNPLLLSDLVGLPRLFDVLRVNNGPGQSIGLLEVLFLLAGLPLAGVLWRRRDPAAALVGGFAGMGLIFAWLQLSGATFVWVALPFLNVLQFRWRLLSMLSLAALPALGRLLIGVPGSLRTAATSALICAFIGLQLPLMYPQLMQPTLTFPPRPTVADMQQLGQQANLPGLASFDEFLPIWRTTPLTEQERRDAALTLAAGWPAGARIVSEQRFAQHDEVVVETPVPFTAAFHVLYYPGWRGYVDGQPQPVQPAPGLGYVSLAVPAGRHAVTLRYEGTPAGRAGDWLSILAALALAGLALLWRPAGRTAPDAAPVYLPRRWWVPGGLVVLIGIKGGWIDPHTAWLRCISTPQHVCGAQTTATAGFVGGPSLRGYAVLTPEVAPGNTVRLTLFWEGSGDSAARLNSFVHVRNSAGGQARNPATGGDIWAQEIHAVSERALLPGKLYLDEYRIALPAAMPRGQYYLEVGWFDIGTGEQLDVDPQGLQAPLRLLWRSVLLPDLRVK